MTYCTTTMTTTALNENGSEHRTDLISHGINDLTNFHWAILPFWFVHHFQQFHQHGPKYLLCDLTQKVSLTEARSSFYHPVCDFHHLTSDSSLNSRNRSLLFLKVGTLCLHSQVSASLKIS